MPEYRCSPCGFLSEKKTDLTRHLATAKHCETVAVNAVNEFVCSNCGNSFSRSSGLSRHKKTCYEGIIKDLETNIIKEDCEKLKKEINRLQKQVTTYETMLKSITTPQIANYFNYICTTFPNPPVLLSQKTHNSIHTAKSMSLIEVIIMYYDNKTLINFIGDYIVGLYKKKEPADQSMWSTDISRLTYIISESCNKKESTWAYDKKGLKIKKIVIEPTLQYIKNTLYNFCQENSTAKDGPEFHQLKGALEIIPMINSGSLADDITRYIAPEFAIKINEADIKTIKF